MTIYWLAIHFGLFATTVRVIIWLGVCFYGSVFNLLFLWLGVAGCGSVLPEITNLWLGVGGCGSVWPGVGGCGSIYYYPIYLASFFRPYRFSSSLFNYVFATSLNY